MNLSPAEIERIKSARRVGRTWAALSREYHCNWETLKRAIDPEFAAKRQAQIGAARKRHGPDPHVFEWVKRIDIPESVLAERDRRLQVKQSLTGLVCGDPPPGYSALDQKQARV